MTTQRISFPSGPLTLEGVLALAPTPDEGPGPGAVVCHPHSLYGGDMESHVVQVVCRALQERGVTSLRFNCRGVGRSEGSFDDGKGEAKDLEAAISVLEKTPGVDPSRIGVAGYSFGASVSIAVAAGDGRVKALAAVSPPADGPTGDQLQRYTRPALLISGGRDHFAPPDRLREVAARAGGSCECHIVPDEDHFWGLRAEEMARLVGDFFAAHLC